MKKLFVVLAVASLGFVACNNDASTEDAEKKTADSIRVADSLAQVQKTADSIANASKDTMSKMAPMVDTTTKVPAKKKK